MVRDYILKKMIFPKLLIVDNPGIIISRNFKRLKGPYYDMRLSYTFEDFYDKLHKKTLKVAGKEETSFLEYIVGKNLATRYFSFNLSKEPVMKPKKLSNFKAKLAIKYLQDAYCGVGMSVCENCKYDLSKKHFSFWGANNAVCRKTGDYSIMEGILSGSVGLLLGENIEAKCEQLDEKVFRINLHPEVTKRYAPDIASFGVSKEYRLNFRRKKFNSKLYSLKDFLKFGIIKMDEDDKSTFLGRTIIPTEFSLPEIFANTYSEFGLGKLFSDSVEEYSEELFSEILDNKNNDEEKIRFFRNTMSALGYGQLFIKKNKNEVCVDFLNPIFLKLGLEYLKHFILGFLNYIYSKKFVVVKEECGRFIYRS